jgi:hypothetical protein
MGMPYPEKMGGAGADYLSYVLYGIAGARAL